MRVAGRTMPKCEKPNAVFRFLVILLASLDACGGAGCPLSDPNCTGGSTGGSGGAVQSVTIVGAPTSLVLGQTAQLTASVSVTGGASQGVSWSSDKPNIISVTNTNPATITGLAVGSAAITDRKS